MNGDTSSDHLALEDLMRSFVSINIEVFTFMVLLESLLIENFSIFWQIWAQFEMLLRCLLIFLFFFSLEKKNRKVGAKSPFALHLLSWRNSWDLIFNFSILWSGTGSNLEWHSFCLRYTCNSMKIHLRAVITLQTNTGLTLGMLQCFSSICLLPKIICTCLTRTTTNS